MRILASLSAFDFRASVRGFRDSKYRYEKLCVSNVISSPDLLERTLFSFVSLMILDLERAL